MRSGRTARSLKGHRRALAVLAATLELPTPSFGRARPENAVTETQIAGHATTVIRPSSPPPWPSLLFANGATPDGRAHPTVLRLAIALARVGHCVYIPDLPGVADGVLTPVTLAAAIDSTIAVAEAGETASGRLGLVGVSIGGTLALLVAAEPRAADRISVVSCIAPYSDLERVILLATTGTYRNDAGSVQPYPVPDELSAGLARSIEELGAGTDAPEIRALLDNREPARFDELYGRLPADVREVVIELSPRHSVQRIVAPVEIATAPRDRYFPLDESVALLSNPCVRLTVTPALAHAVPRFDPRNLPGLLRLERFFARSLVAGGS